MRTAARRSCIEKSGVRAALGTPQGSKRHYRVTLEDGQTLYLRSLVLLFDIEK